MSERLDSQSPADKPREPVERISVPRYPLQVIYDAILSGTFYENYDEASKMTGWLHVMLEQSPVTRSAVVASEPVCYVMMNAAGKMYWDEESCVWSHPGDAEATLENEQDADPDAGWRVVPLHASVAQSASVPFPEEPALGVTALMMSEFGLTRDQARTYYNTMRALSRPENATNNTTDRRVTDG